MSATLWTRVPEGPRPSPTKWFSDQMSGIVQKSRAILCRRQTPLLECRTFELGRYHIRTNLSESVYFQYGPDMFSIDQTGKPIKQNNHWQASLGEPRIPPHNHTNDFLMGTYR
jgi:hypothetical protein